MASRAADTHELADEFNATDLPAATDRSDRPVRSLSLIVPTYREVDNLPALIERIGQVRHRHDLDVEMLIVDDNSNDGTVELIDSLNDDWVRAIVRTEAPDLSGAIIDGFRAMWSW